MQKLMMSVAFLIILASCAPQAGRPAIPYFASPSEIIAAIAQFGPLLEPEELYNFYSIEVIGDSFITLRADPTTGGMILGALAGARVDPVRVTVTVFSQFGPQEVSSVAISELPRGTTKPVEQIIQELDKRFQRVPSPLE